MSSLRTGEHASSVQYFFNVACDRETKERHKKINREKDKKTKNYKERGNKT
jgi:hypothetical protein